MDISRRGFLRTGIAAGAGTAVLQVPGVAHAQAVPGGMAPVIHVADLFHPHGDPDDHFDLAVAYALALKGRFDLRGVVIDYPPDFRPGDPAVVAVTQMNALAGMAVPVAVGTPHRLKSRRDAQPDAPARETAGMRFLLEQLRRAVRPVSVICVGSAADIIVAALREPSLFEEKCAGVYLNSGAAHSNPDHPTILEHNVKLDPAAYAAMFDLPCPLFWFPCWDITERRTSGVDGSFYWLPHKEALDGISAGLANFFAYMFSRSTAPKWLRDARKMPPAEMWAGILKEKRGMWSTASQFAAAGLSVTKDGEIVPAAGVGDAAVFALDAVEVSCADDGRTTWMRTQKAQKPVRRMLRVTDAARYPAAMTRAVSELFKAFN